MKKPTSGWPLAAAAILSSVALAACGSSSSSSTAASAPASSSGSSSASGAVAAGQPTASAATPAGSAAGVTLRVGDQAGTGAEAQLEAAGLLSKLPFKVQFSDFTSGPPILQALSAGDLDVGGVGDAPPVFAAAGGAKIAIVGEYANNPRSAALVVPKGSSITSIAQLKGKKIAVAQGSSDDYHLLTVLKAAGLTPKDVTLDYLQPAEALAALQSGAVDAWDTWSPFIEEATAKGDRILVNGDKYGANYSYVVASQAALANPKLVAAIEDYVKVLAQAHTWVATHPAQWGQSWAKATGLPVATMVQAAKDAANKPIPVGPQTVSSEQGLVNAFYGAGLIPRSFSFGPYVTTALNAAL
jgi:sulfonate transport system substrate-binding protein